MKKATLIILGCGGHAKSIADVALTSGFQSILFIDPNAQPQETYLGFNVLPEWQNLSTPFFVISGAGDPHMRVLHSERMKEKGIPLYTLFSPLATISKNAHLGAGTFVGHHAHIGPLAKVGANCIINTGAIVEHESIIGNYTHVSIRACIAGKSIIGAYGFLGAGAVVIDGIEVKDHITIGAGAIVINSLFAPGVYVGCPAKKIH